MKKCPDWLIRSAKTFVQVFLATLIPAVVIACGSVPATWADVGPWIGSIFTPQLIIGDCLATAICAVWNLILESKEGK